MSQTLGSLTPQEARRLILQGQEMEPVRAKPDVIERISEYTNSHPYLIQLLCSRLFEEDGHLRAPTEDDLQTDPILCGFFAVDFGLLALGDRRLIVAVSEAQRADNLLLQAKLQMSPAEVSRRVHNLIRLGYLRRAGKQIVLGNHFLANWLAGEPDIASLLVARPVAVSETAMQVALAGQQAQETNFLRSQLNAHRARLIELEAVRARDLLQVSPQVLAEIEQHQFHIKHLLPRSSGKRERLRPAGEAKIRERRTKNRMTEALPGVTRRRALRVRTDGTQHRISGHTGKAQAEQPVQISVLVPAHNEVDNLRELVQRVDQAFFALGLAGGAGELVLVDDGSTDGTGPLADSLCAAYAFLASSHHRRNLGLTAALHTGFRAVRGDLNSLPARRFGI